MAATRTSASARFHGLRAEELIDLYRNMYTSRRVDDEEIRLTLITLKSNPSLLVQQLVQAANDNGGRDNISAMLIHVTSPYGVPRGWLARFKAFFR